MRAKSWLISIVAALILGGSSLYFCDFHKPETISGYSQSKNSITIEVTNAVEPVKFLMLQNVPVSLNIEQVKQKSKNLEINDGKITIPIKNEPTDGEYSIIIFLGNDYVELVRQSQRWLKNTFNFDRPGGYTILGRRSFPLKILHKRSYRLWFFPRSQRD